MEWGLKWVWSGRQMTDSNGRSAIDPAAAGAAHYVDDVGLFFFVFF